MLHLVKESNNMDQLRTPLVAMLVLPRLRVGLDRQNFAGAPFERHPTRPETWAKA
jgi:hypothetical protein